MASQSTYLTYKRETAELLYWIIKASNSIIQKTGAADQGGLSLLNTTGKTTVQGLLSMTKLIAQHIGEQTVPPVVYRLFRSVIKARETTHRFFLQLAAEKFDPEIEKSNESHKHFISVLYEAFKALGGGPEPLGTEADVEPSPRAAPIKRGHQDSTTETPENNNVILLANKFASLYLGTADDDEEVEEGDNASDGTSAAASIQKSQKKSYGKRKKGVRGRKSKQKKNSTNTDVKESTLDGMPIEGYRIIEDQEGIMTDYLMATYSLVLEWIALREYLQRTWNEVAYDELNAAIAGAVSNMAISMLKRSELAMHMDFPGHDAFHTVVNTITRGDMGCSQETFKIQMFLLDGQTTHVEDVTLDVKEQCLIYAYNDLLDFINDFQEKRNGRPTKSMLAEIDEWEPDFDLQGATPQERVKWRRSYTINWLYDLVNVTGLVFVLLREIERKNGQDLTLEEIDWSADGPWRTHRRLFGLNDFACEIMSLALLKQGKDVRSKIQPHVVFQLQCIVDSFMVSRGFAVNKARGHVISPPADQFRARRDVDLFLGHKGGHCRAGFLRSVNLLGVLLNDSKEVGAISEERLATCTELLAIAGAMFERWLGVSNETLALDNGKVIPSRFRKTNSNGLWEYSPFLCGVGLTESLEISYLHGMMVFDTTLEPLLLVHIYNMLIQRGFISQPHGVYHVLLTNYPETYFVDGKIPTSNFDEALADRLHAYAHRCARAKRQGTIPRSKPRSHHDFYEILRLDRNNMYRTPSTLMLYRQADWNHERISESDVKPSTMLCALRLGRTELVEDPETGNLKVPETELKRRMRFSIHNEEEFLRTWQHARSVCRAFREHSVTMVTGMPVVGKHMQSSLPELSKKFSECDQAGFIGKDQHKPSDMASIHVLDMLKHDFRVDICDGRLPEYNTRSGINFIALACSVQKDFLYIEFLLRKVRNPSFVSLYESGTDRPRNRRVSLTASALRGCDSECLHIMAHFLQRPDRDYWRHTYWSGDHDNETNSTET